MRSNYKPLGDYIKPVNIRNTQQNAERLLGINIDKFFMPSVANVVGTDLSNYKLVRKNQFACNRMHVGRDYRLPVAMSNTDEEFMVSPAYDVFEIKDTKVLDPEFLMMWFSRKEFDRNAWFYTDGDVRGGLPWKSFQDMKLPIPSITKQKEIVKEYNVIKNRIALNQQMIQKLEETAQAIYKQWFVDFEFPDENGKPYKSNGGQMVFNEELEMEIPKGWDFRAIIDFADEIVTGKTPPTDDEDNFGDFMPFITIPDMHNKIYIDVTERCLSKKGVSHQKNKTIPKNSICVSCIGTAGLVSIVSESSQTNQQINSIICKENIGVSFLFFILKTLEQQIIQWGGKGSVGVNMNKTEFSSLNILKPSDSVIFNFENQISSFMNCINIYQKQLLVLLELLRLMNSKMSQI